MSTTPPVVIPAESPAELICDISNGEPFLAGTAPPTPILVAFGSGSLHEYRIRTDCDLQRALDENSAALVRSRRWLRERPPEREEFCDDLTFQFGPRRFIHAECGAVSGFAEERDDSERLAVDFVTKYKRLPKPSGGCFQLIKTRREDIETESVSLEPETILSDETLALHYGDDFVAWHTGFIGQLAGRACGFSIFEGAPGTGKTSYLRHLMGVLRESHRFYFVPPSRMSLLTKPDFVEFWVAERRRHKQRRLVVVLEDAEEAIMRRGCDNSAHVSAILNLSDGLLADFLRLQIICTMNCGVADIDRALLRPGRLICHRIFARLDHVVAARLAKHLGRTLPVASDYSLAEIFASCVPTETRRIGFSV